MSTVSCAEALRLAMASSREVNDKTAKRFQNVFFISSFCVQRFVFRRNSVGSSWNRFLITLDAENSLPVTFPRESIAYEISIYGN